MKSLWQRFRRRVLSSPARRSVVGQLAVGAALLVIAPPAAYLYGMSSQMRAFDATPLEGFWRESAAIDPVVVLPPAELERVLFPLGPAEMEASQYNGRDVWKTTYSLSAQERPETALREIARVWRDERLEVAPQADAKAPLVAATRDGRVTSVAAPSQSDPNVLEVFCWSEAAEDARHDAPEQFFALLRLPAPPADAEVYNYSHPDSANALALRTSDYPEDLLRDYTAQMRRMGWSAKALPGGAPIPSPGGGVMELYEREGRRVMLQVSETPDGQGALLSLVAL